VYDAQFLSYTYISNFFAGGMTLKRSARLTSFCAHAILQRCEYFLPENSSLIVRRGDEPTVILDTKLDWRFAKNVSVP
jgi:hypothetical protein